MIPSSNRSKRNLIWLIAVIFAIMLALIIKVGWIVVIHGDEYSILALQQQTRDTTIEAERGTIYDTNGKELAVSVTCYTIWVRPGDVQSGENKIEAEANKNLVKNKLSEILDMDEGEVEELVTKEQNLVKIKKGVDKATADKIREEKLRGVEIVEDTMRSYPMGAFASHVLGTVSSDNNGLGGLELEYNSYLSGIEGRESRYTDTRGNSLSYGKASYYAAEDGYNLVTTIDSVIQYYTEESLKKVQKDTKADRVQAIVMDPKTGDILAMAQTPDFDLNNPQEPLSKKEKAKFEKLSTEEKQKYIQNMWRNPLICDVYEPGSTFKLLTTAIALEEDAATLKSTYYDKGYIRIADATIHCWRTGQPHGKETLAEAVSNSCNPVFVKLANKVGITKYYDHLDTFGITGRTDIDFPGEGTAIMQSEDTAGPVGLGTIGFGQGIAVTPIQLITAISSFGNDGKMMKPRLVKEITDNKGKTVKEFDTEVVRQTVSKETADEMCEIMQFVVDNGGAGTVKIKGYNVGAKTGTANKVRNGKYVDETYSSAIAMAPMEDPKVAVLLIVDNPKGIHYGGVVAGPGTKRILKNVLNYMNVVPDETADDEDKEELVKVPDMVGKNASECVELLASKDLKHDYDEKAAEASDFTVTKQYPEAGMKVKKGTKVYLYD
ncbi:MAG: PASTA domain-containing protein [Eubacterium sp.]|nr:PASTA domain-containing protein [Candidatus Colimonas fimequi]